MYKKILTLLIIAGMTMPTLVACGGDDENHQQPRQNRQVQNNQTNADMVVANANVADGLDLSRLPALVRQARNAEDLEQRVNQSGLNNVDVNNDGNIDYINVEEFREGNDRGFILYTNENNQRNDLATISMTRSGNNADVDVSGNPQYYPTNNHYRQSFPWGELLVMAWLFNMSRPVYYHRPYYHGYYPSYYRSTRVVPVASYRTKVSRYKSYTPSFNASRSSSSSYFQKKSLANTSGGSTFSTTTNKRSGNSTGVSTSGFGGSSSRSSGGFGNSSSRSSSNNASGFGNSSSRNSSFGSSPSRSSFGGSSSRSSFGSSSSRSRSSSSSRRRR